MLTVKEVITSRQNPTVKRICALCDKKSRKEEELFRFDGIKLFGEAVACGLCIEYVVVREDAIASLGTEIENCVRRGCVPADRVLAVSESVFSKLSEEKSPDGIITVAKFIACRHRTLSADECESYTLPLGERLLIAQSLRDPGNLGTVIRSCAALGIDRLVISDDCADLYNPKTIRGAMGGLFRLNTDILPCSAMPSAIRSLRKSGRRIYAAALHKDAEIIGKLRLSRSDCFVIGNEGHGLSEDVIEACDDCALIPMVAGSESLNAAAAASICIWETVRAD